MLFYPALQVIGLLERAAQVYQLAGLRRFGVQQVFTEMFWALLQEPSIERVKHVMGVISARSWTRSEQACDATALQPWPVPIDTGAAHATTPGGRGTQRGTLRRYWSYSSPKRRCNVGSS